jgi:hypothetical protein
MENNVFALNQTEAEESGFGVSNTFGNDETVLKGNLFYLCQGGYYKYMDENKQSLVAWKKEDLKALNGDGEPYMLAESGGNTDEDPKFSPDKDFFEKFSNFVASKPGKLNMDAMNEWRRSVGLPLQAEPGSARKNYGMAYPLAGVVPGLVSKVAGKGAQVEGPFQAYQSSAAPAEKKEYVEVAFDSFKKGSAGLKELAGKAVTIKVGLGSNGTTFLLAAAPRDKYDHVKLLKPGATEPTMDVINAYVLRGSDAAKEWEKLFKKKDKYKDGIVVKGTLWYAGADTYAYPVCLIIEEVSKG